MNDSRRKFTALFASLFALAGGRKSAAQDDSTQVRKLNFDGKPASPTSFITSLITHNGLIYISGQGANDAGSVQQNDIETHTRKVMENVKHLVETGGGTMDSILQLTVYLASLSDYDGMNKVFKTYFPHGGPARTTVAVAGVPGKSLLEINCIAAVTRR